MQGMSTANDSITMACPQVGHIPVAAQIPPHQPGDPTLPDAFPVNLLDDTQQIQVHLNGWTHGVFPSHQGRKLTYEPISPASQRNRTATHTCFSIAL